MTSSDQESTAAFVEDYECLIEGVIYFLRLHSEVSKHRNIDAIIQHYEKNPEDKLCHIYRPNIREMLLCRRSGIDAIRRMSLRLVSEAQNGYDLSPTRIAEIISNSIFQVAIDNVTDDELVRILKSYVSKSESEHVEVRYHFPCVLLHREQHHDDLGPPHPDEFSLGPVSFQQIDVFLRSLTRDAEAGRKNAEGKAIEIFTESGNKFGWVASVSVPRCASDISRLRAEEIIEAAINLLKVFIGLRYGKSMRLPHTAPARNRETCVLAEINDTVRWTWHGRALEGALVAGNPTSLIPTPIRDFAASLLTEGLTGNGDEATNRLLDALKWFGDASFEESPGVQIVKWIAALERLTATEQLHSGITHRFCMRVAVLASGLGAGDVEKAYRDARHAYELRSDVMHGSRSQDDKHLSGNTGLVHDLTREAVIGALAVHHFLRSMVKDLRIESMTRFYKQNEQRYEVLFKKLEQEFRSNLPQKKRPR